VLFFPQKSTAIGEKGAFLSDEAVPFVCDIHDPALPHFGIGGEIDWLH